MILRTIRMGLVRLVQYATGLAASELHWYAVAAKREGELKALREICEAQRTEVLRQAAWITRALERERETALLRKRLEQEGVTYNVYK